MLFKYPAVLYALLALLIPVIIHLFKLRKFQKTAFTNVVFLEKIKIQSRKSSRLKKWLVLFSRLGLLACAIVAFAFPYLPAKSNTEIPESYIVYLDNSFSMQAKGTSGSLLNKALQDIINEFEPNTVFSLFTNTDTFSEVQLSEIQNELLDIDYVEEQLSPEQIKLKFNSLSKNNKRNALIAISDFQIKNNSDYSSLLNHTDQLIQLLPQKASNVSIDSLWITLDNNQKKLHIAASSSELSTKNTISVLNKDKLIGKASLDFSKKQQIITQVPLQDNILVEGVVSLEAVDALAFDNKRYFSINQNKKPTIKVIGSGFIEFLQKIYPRTEFSFTSINTKNTANESFEDTDLLILNEVKSISTELSQKIIAFEKSGGTLCIIPSRNADDGLASFLNSAFKINLGEYVKIPKKLTQINFQHKLLKGVFSKEIANFQYPTIKEGYTLNTKNWVFNYEDNTPFLIQKDNIFVFASPLSEDITNFKKSPLIVPAFYNMTQQNGASGNISYTVGEKNDIIIEANMTKDDVITVKGSTSEFIPLQQLYKNYIKFTTQEFPSTAGNYKITANKKPIYTVSYNYPTGENQLDYANFENKDKLSNSLTDYFNTSKANFKTTDLWKWFLIFALFFLLIEIILLKFLK